MVRKVRKPDRFLDLPDPSEHAETLRKVAYALALLLRNPVRDELYDTPCIIEHRQGSVFGARELACGVDHRLQHRRGFEARGDPRAQFSEQGEATSQAVDLNT